jgi:tyrosine-protein phosphatase YwqE
MSNKKQTAVQWLEEQFKKVNHLTETEWIELFNQGKEIEKQQIIDAYDSKVIETLANEYYNENYEI